MPLSGLLCWNLWPTVTLCVCCITPWISQTRGTHIPMPRAGDTVFLRVSAFSLGAHLLVPCSGCLFTRETCAGPQCSWSSQTSHDQWQLSGDQGRFPERRPGSHSAKQLALWLSFPKRICFKVQVYIPQFRVGVKRPLQWATSMVSGGSRGLGAHE